MIGPIRSLASAILMLLAGCGVVKSFHDSDLTRDRLQAELGLDVRRVHDKTSVEVDGRKVHVLFVSLATEPSAEQRIRIAAIARESVQKPLDDVVVAICPRPAECPDPPGY